MVKLKLFYLPICLMVLLTQNTFGQGCSDAGFCTVNSFKPNDQDSSKSLINQFKIGVFYGNADRSISVFGNYFEFNRQVNEKLGVDLKLTTLAQNGNGISTFGVSDVFINANYRTSQKLRFTLGVKIPLNNANKSLENLPLPMDYQSSLGTLDLIFGIGYTIKNLQIVAAIQQPLTQNGNQFLASQYPLESELLSFQSTNKYMRSGDAMLRVSYPIEISRKLKLTPSVLPIYHLANDHYTDEFNIEREIFGSQGLTLNGNIYLDYNLSRKSTIQINMGIPFIVRDSRPDGLTRSFIANLEYQVRF